MSGTAEASGSGTLERLGAAIRRRLGPAPDLRSWPRISIVVVNRDGAPLLRRLLTGLVKHTDYPDLELIVIDNASSDDSLELLRSVEAPFPITSLANSRNESFADASNRGAAVARGELLLFLNNDAEPFESAWLRELTGCLHSHDAGAVGPTLIEPDDTAPCGYRVEQRGHGVAEREGTLVPVYREQGREPLGEELGEDTEVAAMAAACLLMTREAFDRVGGFTSGYWYGGEDSDLALRLRERGRTILCSGRSLLVHSPGSTLEAIDSGLRGEWVSGNRRLFLERWGPRLRREYELDRLRGGGLWSEAGRSGASTWGTTPAEIEALGFCLESTGGAPEPPLDDLTAALRRRGRRSVVLGDGQVECSERFDYDVVVYFGSPRCEAPYPSQINLRWLPAGAGPPASAESRRYDLVLEGDPNDMTTGVDRLAGRLIALAEGVARRRGFRRRVMPETDVDR